MWQACPICKGSGYTPGLFGTVNRCRTCLTSGVINELTGLPPKHFIEQEEIRRDVKGIGMIEHDVNQLTLPFTERDMVYTHYKSAASAGGIDPGWEQR